MPLRGVENNRRPAGGCLFPDRLWQTGQKFTELGREFRTKAKNVLRSSLTLTQQDIADLVGTTRESINKELKILREKGVNWFIEALQSDYDAK